VATFFTWNGMNWALGLEGLALAACLGLILMLLRNRRRYGHLVLPRPDETPNFDNEIARQMLSQQSRQAFLRLQQALARELDCLPQSGEPGQGAAPHANRQSSEAIPASGHQCPSNAGRQSQLMAAQMLTQGRSVPDVAAACKLPLSAVGLIGYVQRKSRPS
jgi:hypothetical protein